MKKTMISLAVAATFSSGVAQAMGTPTVTTLNNNFTMVGATNGNTGGTNDVTFSWDGTYRTAVSQELGGLNNATLSSPTAFAGKKWTAHHVNVYGPGTYTFYADCASGGVASTTYDPTCGLGVAQTLTVGAGQVGAHMLFNWSTSADIDVIVVWDMNKSWVQTGTVSPFNLSTNTAGNTASTLWNGVSIDADGDTYNGAKMVDGPFIGQSANFSVNGILPLIPAVETANPNGTGIGTSSVVTVAFNQPMDPVTLTLASFTVKAGGVGSSVCGGSITASADHKVFTCTPAALAANTAYTVTVTTAASNTIPVGLASNSTWTFTTSAAAATTTLSSTAAPGTTTVSIPSGNGSLATVGLLTAAQVTATAPANVTFSEGLVSYKITGVTAASTVPVTIVFPASIAGKTLYKVDTTVASPVYTAIPESAFTRVNSTTITMNITDCTVAPCTGYDANATSGTIEDPIGAGTAVVTVVPTLGSAPGGGGCAFGSNGKFDPTLILALLGSLGYLGWKRKQRD
jgi:hypothetical protein